MKSVSVSITFIIATALVAYIKSAVELVAVYSGLMRQGAKQMATLFKVILLKCYLEITSFLRKSMRKIKVNLFNYGNYDTISLINSFLFVTPWSCISIGNALKGIMGYFKL